MRTLFVATLLPVALLCVSPVQAFNIKIPGLGGITIELPGVPVKIEDVPAPGHEPSRSGQSGQGNPSVESQRGEEIRGASPHASARSAQPPSTPRKNGVLTYQDALQCAGLIEMANVIKQQGNNSSDPRLVGVVQPNATNRSPIWDQMVALHPEMSRASPQAAELQRRVLLNKYMNENFDRYRSDLDLLKKDYGHCKGLGLIKP